MDGRRKRREYGNTRKIYKLVKAMPEEEVSVEVEEYTQQERAV